MQPWYFYGKKFGYIVAFKPHDAYDWFYETISDPETRRYVHRESYFIPTEEDFQVREFQVKIKSFNVKGDGPFSLTKVIYYPRDGMDFGFCLSFGFSNLLGRTKHVTLYFSDFCSPYRVPNRRLCQASVLHWSSGLVAASSWHWNRSAAVHWGIPGKKPGDLHLGNITYDI